TMNETGNDPIHRREFLARGASAGALAAGLPIAVSARPASARATRIDTRLAARQLDSREFTLSEYDTIRPALSFSAATAEEAAEWRSVARARLVELLGG